MAPDDTAAQNYGLASPLMLEKIDKLFACGVGELVNLPQIVVVGDQSCGKSSVLEGLIKKPLPRDSGLCTRFATQIVFRRAVEASIFVSIIPDTSASPEYCSRLKAWGKPVSMLDSTEFAAIMQEVHELMGLSTANDDSGIRKPTFSNDVFRLEISGPEQEHLSVVDVPGIFKSTTEGLTTKADIQLVRSMVKSYMDNPRSVMLAVVPANVDVATQEILELAAEADPQQDRTLGVLTKPDLVDRGAEPKVLDLLDGHSRPFKLGWHMIRNPGQSDLLNKSIDRDTLEMDFFRSETPWNSIDKVSVGITALRVRLSDVLASLLKREFPKVKVDIKGKLDDRQRKLDGLGPERSGPAEQSAYLIKVATQFQQLVQLALNANHGADNAFEREPALHISPKMMARMKEFADDMTDSGQTYSFLMADEDGHTLAASPGDDLSEEDEEECKEVEEVVFGVRAELDIEELEDILHNNDAMQYPIRGTIQKWLQEVYADNRGFELGTFNGSILTTVMKKQSSKWKDISLGFVSDVIVLVHKFITKALGNICTDSLVCQALVNTLFDELVQRYQKAIHNANFLLEVENNDIPMTLNHYFNDNLQKSRQGKVIAVLKKSAFKSDKYGGELVRLEHAMQTCSMSNDNHTIIEIHDILQSYYKVSLKTFIDNVCKQSALHYLLHSDKGPLALFSPTFVSELSQAQLEEVAGEAPPQKRLRLQLKKDIDSLTKAVKILRQA